MRQLQGSDASFVMREKRNTPMHIGSILIYDPSTAPGGKVSFDDILRFFASRLQLSRTVRERLVRVPFDLDYPYWIEDENFDLEYHVRRLTLPAPGDWQQLCHLAAQIFSHPLDLDRPPWEFTMVEGLGDIPGLPPGSYAMITKVHHAALDGLSGIDLMEALHTLTPEAPPPLSRDRWRPEPVPTERELLARYLVNAVSHPIERVRVAVQAAPGLMRVARGLLEKEFSVGDMIGPKTRFNVPLSPHRVVEGRRMALRDLKAIRSLAPGSWVNDVFLAIIGGALREYLALRRDLPPKSLTSLVPISVRSRREKRDGGNQVAAMIVPLGTHIADPAERLRYVHARTQNSKAMTSAIGARNMSDVSKVSPALFLAMGAQLNAGLGLTKRMSPPYSTLVTNVPGPRVPIYSAGARLHSMLGMMCLTEGLGLAHVVQSYLSEATISFTADRELMPDPEDYAACIEKSFTELLEAARANAAANPRRTAAARSGATDKEGALASTGDGSTATSAPQPDLPAPAKKPRRRKAERGGNGAIAEAASDGPDAKAQSPALPGTANASESPPRGKDASPRRPPAIETSMTKLRRAGTKKQIRRSGKQAEFTGGGSETKA